ncbi:glycosyltransferase [Curtobacterium sp. 260]|uniref:glycosyltransferase n=1 Tax=Curtobacterium sp. 260 TaxID=2817748 RepID=UPI00278778D2|nr:glycosyltransferase [Curtobacterium sp. 260]MDP9736950.1 glycosyltransferase involved in cell wall biosynthesis [Curtobacterium sp. 260]
MAEGLVDLSYSYDHKESRAWSIIRRGAARFLGFDLAHAWRNRRAFRQADVIWTHTEREWIAIGILSRLCDQTSPPVLAQSVWLYDGWLYRTRLGALITRFASVGQQIEMVHSSINAELAQSRRPDRIILQVPFGTSVTPSLPAAHAAPMNVPFVLAPGNDRHRDWVLLAAVARARPDLRFFVACDPRKIASVRLPQNVEVRRVSQVAEMATLYASASCVLVPLAANTHASGATVVQEAHAFGTPVVVADVGGISDYLEPSDRLFGEGDIDECLREIEAALNSPEPVHKEPREQNVRRYVGAHLILSEALVGLRPLAEADLRAALLRADEIFDPIEE